MAGLLLLKDGGMGTPGCDGLLLLRVEVWRRRVAMDCCYFGCKGSAAIAASRAHRAPWAPLGPPGPPWVPLWPPWGPRGLLKAVRRLLKDSEKKLKDSGKN